MIRALTVAFLLVTASAHAGPKTDLSAYFPPGGTVGDTAVWQSDAGGTRVDELIDIFSGRKGVLHVTQSTEDGFVVLSEAGVIPGKWLLQGSALSNDLEFYFPKLVKRLRMKVVPGKAYRYGGSGRVYYQGERVGKVTVKGSITFVGFAPVVTPYFTGTDSAHFVESATITVKFKGLGQVSTESQSTWSIDRLLGSLESTELTRTYEDGVLVEEEGPTTWWFESGVFGGVAVP